MALRIAGPITGDATPNHGGTPDASGCRGCTDCCHLSELSITDEEATRLQRLYQSMVEATSELTNKTRERAALAPRAALSLAQTLASSSSASTQPITEPLGELRLRPDPNFEGWSLMTGPCVFRRLQAPLAEGGCRIYEERPSVCDRFTCAYLLQLRRDR